MRDMEEARPRKSAEDNLQAIKDWQHRMENDPEYRRKFNDSCRWHRMRWQILYKTDPGFRQRHQDRMARLDALSLKMKTRNETRS